MICLCLNIYEVYAYIYTYTHFRIHKGRSLEEERFTIFLIIGVCNPRSWTAAGP